jgi:flavin reductase (DIM6/NTAB) family NADH-FMN oxidoreductase RutF
MKTTVFSENDILQMDTRSRAALINSLSGFKSASLIGTADTHGNTNLAIFSSVVHIGSNPALIGFINRPREAAPHTLSNIEETGIYTINHIQMNFVEKAHQTSAKYPEGVSEFEKVELSPEKREDCIAPFVKESPVKFSMVLKEIIPIRFNNTYFVIGAIRDIYLDASIVEEDGCLNFYESEIITSIGINRYASVDEGIKLAYAKSI